MLHETARESDILSRSGGEEFLVILPQTNGGSAHIVGKRMRAAVEAANGPLNAVTVSIGVCALRVDHADFAALLRGVDPALYHSKAAGRNQLGA